MKKLFTILCAGLLTLGVSAQTEAGNMMVGATSNLSFSSTSLDEDLCSDCDAATDLKIGGSYGYFVIDNLALIATVDFSSTSDIFGNEGGQTTFGIAGRYYMGGLFAGAGWSSLTPKDADEGYSIIGLTAGYAHMLTDNISLEPQIVYGMASYDGEAYSNTFGVKIGLGCYF